LHSNNNNNNNNNNNSVEYQNTRCCYQRSWNWNQAPYMTTLHDKLVHTVRTDRRSCLHRISSKQHNAKASANSFMSLPHYLPLSVSPQQTTVQPSPSTSRLGVFTSMIRNKTGNVQITYHSGAFVQPLFHWESHEYYILWVCLLP
jgi:hypothetical protein